MMQRTGNDMSRYVSGKPALKRAFAAARAALAFSRSGDNGTSGGILPSGGSTISDVRRSAVIFNRRESIQCSL